MRDDRFGYFEHPRSGRRLTLRENVVSTSHSDLRREYTLLEDVVFVDPTNTKHRIPALYRFNGLSVPRIGWGVVSPDDPGAFAGSAIHDWYCEHRLVPRKHADWLFYCAMRARGWESSFVLS